jgi:hypothetical protein
MQVIFVAMRIVDVMHIINRHGSIGERVLIPLSCVGRTFDPRVCQNPQLTDGDLQASMTNKCYVKTWCHSWVKESAPGRTGSSSESTSRCQTTRTQNFGNGMTQCLALFERGAIAGGGC